ncbi:MAG: type I pullulanase [Paludibacteraceae bacterium]|nr:type I pullulanase [Paludibacteraceae bacterium]
MKKTILLMMASLTLISCGHKLHYASVDEYPVKKGSVREVAYTPDETTFTLWSPNADSVILNLYAAGEGGEPIRTQHMVRRVDGTWETSVVGDLKGQFYTFHVVQANSKWELKETPGIFAVAVGVNGRRGAIIDLAETNPEGWNKDVRPAMKDASDAIIYELHHRDFSIHPSSGIQNKGKFLALTEHGTVSPEGEPTGIDHLKQLGVTHIQILPSYDYGSIDETHLADNKYNWGYDPVNYNVPEGGYSTNPYDPMCRIREFKQMIQALHAAGFRVILDVVYNHTYDVAQSNFTQTCPDYFYRTREDGSLGNASGCGNETASERPMMRKFMLESVRYWAEEYHLDGFRFDLMAIHDIETMKAIRKMLDGIDPTILLYGEGWAAETPLTAEEARPMKANIFKMPGIGAFSDELRDGLRGSCFDDKDEAFLAAEPGHEQSIRFGLVGAIQHPQVDMEKVNYSREPWALQPTQMIAYASCHDDMMLTDRLRSSVKPAKGKKAIKDDELQRLDMLAQTAILTSQGIPFIFAGEEVMRDKKGVHNSYCSPDDINAIDWSLKAKNKNLFDYYASLIALRKAHKAFHLGDAELVRKHLEFLDTQDGVVAFRLKDHAGGDAWKDIVVVLNANRKPVSIDLPAEGEYKPVIGTMPVAAQSATILAQE